MAVMMEGNDDRKGPEHDKMVADWVGSKDSAPREHTQLGRDNGRPCSSKLEEEEHGITSMAIQDEANVCNAEEYTVKTRDNPHHKSKKRTHRHYHHRHDKSNDL